MCGFPCQPFSNVGKRKGFKDKRSNAFWSCLKIIKHKRPKHFILENVKGILWNDKKNKKDKYGRTWEIIWTSLKKLEKYGYQIKWKVLNTRDYGIPQNRERLYIIGTKNKKEFKWPKKLKMDNLKKYVDWKDNTNGKTSDRLYKHISKHKNKIFIDLSFVKWKSVQNNNYCSCQNTPNNFWCIPMKRHANLKELLSLQGFNKNFKYVINISQMKKQIGNSMSVNVLSSILKNLL